MAFGAAESTNAKSRDADSSAAGLLQSGRMRPRTQRTETAATVIATFLGDAAIVIDMTGDVATAFSLTDSIQPSADSIRIAVCPAGNIFDAMGERLFDLGFAAVLQKPLHCSRLLDVIRISMSSMTTWRAADHETPPKR